MKAAFPFFTLIFTLLLLSACGNSTVETSVHSEEMMVNVLCSPWDNENDPDYEYNSPPDSTYGIRGELYYRRDIDPKWSSSLDYYAYGTLISSRVYLNRFYVPTRMWDLGYETTTGELLKDQDGNVLNEYFGLKFRGFLTLGEHDFPNKYQIAVLSDDGSLLYVGERNQLFDHDNASLIVDNNGNHSTRMGCATQPIEFTSHDDVIPYELFWHQGPRYHIALVVMWREWPDVAGPAPEVQCGQQGNHHFFDPKADGTSSPKQTFFDLLERGWRVLGPENFILPVDDLVGNPCMQY